MKVTTQTIRSLKHKRPIVAITAYDAVSATLADRAGVDLLLVGDSVGTTLLGFETTIPVTLDMMVHHTAAVTRANPNALVVADIPFKEGRHSQDRLLDTCARLMQEGGAQAVKLEGGQNIAPSVARLVQAGIPVLGHIGLLPQRYFALGGYRKFGKNEAERDKLLADARALESAGAFAIIGELIDAEWTSHISQQLAIPFIGIGCGPHCDGQILVYTDILGLTLGKYPSFAKKYAAIGDAMQNAYAEYVREVQGGLFPERTQ